jgi:hypothetical protein
MNKSLMIVVACLSSVLSQGQQKAAPAKKIILTNTSSISLTDKPISVKRVQLPSIPSGEQYPLILSEKGDTIPAQLDDLDEDSKWDEIFFVVNLPAKSSRMFSLKWVSAEPVYVKRTSIRFGKRMSAQERVRPATDETMYARDLPRAMGFQRYQTDGPTWENDKVGFRHYLDGRNAKDVFGKKAPYISPEDVGINAKGETEDNYHVMEPWGRDILAVQNSIGIGGVAMLKNDSILRLGVTVEDKLNNVEKTTFHIVKEGPVRSIMNFRYFNWKPDNKSYNVEETTSIWPGMYAYHNKVKISGTEGGENLLLGMVSIFASKPPVEVRVNDKWVALVSHDRHSYNQEWWLGLALIVPAESYLGLIEAPKKGQLSNSYLAKMKMSPRPIEYYAVACWEISDPGFKDPVYFKNYVVNLTKQISADVKVVIQ